MYGRHRFADHGMGVTWLNGTLFFRKENKICWLEKTRWSFALYLHDFVNYSFSCTFSGETYTYFSVVWVIKTTPDSYQNNYGYACKRLLESNFFKKNEHSVPMLIATFSESIVPGLMSDIYHWPQFYFRRYVPMTKLFFKY